MKKYSKEIQIRRKDLCPIGYKMNQLTNSIEIDEVKATEIRNMFNTLAYEEPLSDEDITYMLVSLGNDGLAVISSIIQNSFYCGVIERNGEYYQGIHTPLIDMMTWGIANENLANMLEKMVEIIKDCNNDKH